MRIRLCSTSLYLAAFTVLCSLLVLCSPHLLWAYGGGGGGGGGAGGGDGSAGQAGAIQPLTSQQIENIFGRVGKGPGLSSQAVETAIKTFQGKKVDPKLLLRIRQRMLEIEKRDAHFWSSFWGGAVVVVETTDTVGGWSQFALSFVPGVGWVTNAGLSLARSGANAYKKGGDAGQIAKAMTVDGVTSLIFKGNSLSKTGKTCLSRSARVFKASTQQTSKTVEKMLVKQSKSHLIKAAANLGLYKGLKKGTKAVVGKTATMIQNNIPSPTYSSSSSGGWGPHFVR